MRLYNKGTTKKYNRIGASKSGKEKGGNVGISYLILSYSKDLWLQQTWWYNGFDKGLRYLVDEVVQETTLLPLEEYQPQWGKLRGIGCVVRSVVVYIVVTL